MREEICTLRALREDRGWTQVQVAAAARTTPRTVSRIERGDIAGMSIALLFQVAGTCGVSIVELVPVFGIRPRECSPKLKA